MMSLNRMFFTMILLAIATNLFAVGGFADTGDHFTQVSSRGDIALALREDGSVWEWGELIDHYDVPVQVDISDVTSISAGFDHAIALKKDGTVWAWGYNTKGQLGDGTNITSKTPRQVQIAEIKAISAGYTYSMALKEDGTVWTWGSNWNGELGDGSQESRAIPVMVEGLINVTQIYAGSRTAYAKKADGSIWGWGENVYEITGDKCVYGIIEKSSRASVTSPIRLDISDVKKIQYGGLFAVALKNDGTLWGWGNDYDSELGDGGLNDLDNHYRFDPVPLPGNGYVDVDIDFRNGIALKNDGTAWKWGGDFSSSPTVVKISGVSQVEAGTNYFIILKNDGTVWQFGSSNNGQSVSGSMTQSLSEPVKVLGTPVDKPGVLVSTSMPSPTTETAIEISSQTGPSAQSTVTPNVPTTTPGMSFSTIAELGCLFVTAGLLSGFRWRKDR